MKLLFNQGMLVGLGCLFLAGAIALIIYLCKTHRRSKQRKYMLDDEQILIANTPKPSQIVRPVLRPSNRNVGVSTNRPITRQVLRDS